MGSCLMVKLMDNFTMSLLSSLISYSLLDVEAHVMFLISRRMQCAILDSQQTHQIPSFNVRMLIKQGN